VGLGQLSICQSYPSIGISEANVWLYRSAESFSQQWSASVASLSSSLERNDRIWISRCKSFDDVQKLFPRTQASLFSTAALQELTELTHTLEKLQDFVEFVSNEAKPATDNSIFWGLVGLVVHVYSGLRVYLQPRF
jgi:hypothetical protein